jgi:hypothetical protein
MARIPPGSAAAPAGYGAGVGLGLAEADAATEAEAVVDAPADWLGEAAPEPLGAGVLLAVGRGLGDGKMRLGTLATDRAKISTKMAMTPMTHGFARRSLRGGSAPRYPGAGASPPRSAPLRF